MGEKSPSIEMTEEQKFEQWFNIAKSLRPIWNQAKGNINNNKEAWDIVHKVSATPDAFRNFMDIEPMMRKGAGWAFKAKAPKLTSDLNVIQQRISRGDRITKRGVSGYNMEAFRAVMAIKDIFWAVEAHSGVTPTVTHSPEVNDLFDTGL